DVLTAIPCAPHLQRLWLTGCGMGDDALTRFLACDRFTKIDWMHLGNETTGSEFGPALARAKLPALRELMLGSCDLADPAVAELANGPLLAQIEELDLTLNSLTTASAEALARSKHCGSLKKLNIGFSDIGDDGVRAIMASRKFPKLNALHL